MIVKKLVAKKVFGYLDFNIAFNTDISFLVGGNGSGKTTALKLMNALVNPNFKDLLQIPFESVSLDLSEKDRIIQILASSNEDGISVRVSTIDDVLILPSFSNEEMDYYSHSLDKIDEISEKINRKFADHPIVKEISKVDSPIFLGLDRRRDDALSVSDDYYFERDLWLREKNKRSLRARRLIKGSIGISLMETEMLVQHSYKRMRELEDKYSSKLRDSILLSAFQYTSFNSVDFSLEKVDWKERTGVLERKKEIREALSNIGLNDSTVSKEVDTFFQKLTDLFESVQKTKEGVSVEWLLNKAQVERMSKIVEIIDEHKSKVDNFFKPINDFLSVVNSFYKDSNKSLEVDMVGQLVVARPDKSKCTIEGLSSGERQLLVIFAHSFFNRRSKKKNVFIIDEPELSLHLGWQEKFSETIFSINPNSQYILATHSPEIVGSLKNKAVKCR
ncbi:AAA family ATPase [Spartinivicinus poritis]|uniref:AAA family ATPase n=1 Tax=Spartinivicinus poritis TaxID=2994640 RepID=A0ABT5U3Y0_9GAMM|nr:AAA family ATPase [Spartinivicinus sp. A2-2]MDE1460920.1 AAA family ATPase [Spartinivicinus sp. A2-2]